MNPNSLKKQFMNNPVIQGTQSVLINHQPRKPSHHSRNNMALIGSSSVPLQGGQFKTVISATPIGEMEHQAQLTGRNNQAAVAQSSCGPTIVDLINKHRVSRNVGIHQHPKSYHNAQQLVNE